MLGLLLIYYIGRYFYNLANDHNKNKWVYAVLDVISYYVGNFVAWAIFGIELELWKPDNVDTVNEWLFGLLMLPFGILSCFGFYKLLQRNWENKGKMDTEFLDNMDI